MVLDLETTGLNVNRDIVISIGAVTIEAGAIDMAQQFECTLRRQVEVNEAVLIHGIAPSELANGEPPAEALLSFMEFAADSVMLAFHAPFDQRMLADKQFGFFNAVDDKGRVGARAQAGIDILQVKARDDVHVGRLPLGGIEHGDGAAGCGLNSGAQTVFYKNHGWLLTLARGSG